MRTSVILQVLLFAAGAAALAQSAGTFTAPGEMMTARDAHAATRLPRGKGLIAGGYGAGTGLTGPELYDRGVAPGSAVPVRLTYVRSQSRTRRDRPSNAVTIG